MNRSITPWRVESNPSLGAERARAPSTNLLLLLLVLIFPAPLLGQQIDVGIQTILPGTFSVVHSGLSRFGSVFNSSNIYVIKGFSDTVWIFGTGYGDRGTPGVEASDIEFYRGAGWDATRDAIDDAREVDSIITNDFGLRKSDIKLMFVVPHFHLDHINKEFVAAFFEVLGYQSTGTKIFVHTNDSLGTTCNSPCCGAMSCSGASPYFGAPFHRPWTPDYLKLFQAVGSSDDVCNNVVKTITSEAGTWLVRKAESVSRGGHTDGTVNLDNVDLKWRITGADGGVQCSLPDGWVTYGIHGNIRVPTGVDNTSGLRRLSHATLHPSFPNPFNSAATIRYEIPRRSFVRLRIFNLLGQEVATLVDEELESGSYEATWSPEAMASGVYIYRLVAGDVVAVKRLVLLK